MAATWVPASRLGSEFMPALNEGTLLLHMPASLPGMSITKAAEVLQTQDKIIKELPGSCFGLWQGRARQHRHRPGAGGDVRDRHQPQAAGRMARRHDDRQADRRDGPGAAVPGISNAWTMPIKARIDMLSTGIRTPIGIKGLRQGPGRDGKLAKQIETVVKTVPGTTSAFAERLTGG